MPRKRNGPHLASTGRPQDIAPGNRVTAASVNVAALRRLVELHCRGWLTRRELEAEFGLPYRQLTAIALAPYWRLS